MQSSFPQKDYCAIRAGDGDDGGALGGARVRCTGGAGAGGLLHGAAERGDGHPGHQSAQDGAVPQDAAAQRCFSQGTVDGRPHQHVHGGLRVARAHGAGGAPDVAHSAADCGGQLHAGERAESCGVRWYCSHCVDAVVEPFGLQEDAPSPARTPARERQEDDKGDGGV
ncbi:unnamed protein product [Phytophthora lilii]|uniref:Unnamed protein product n=1 Tax=Phytophthora lilii TaxID=2077276 RepID=A0A9W6UE50_9STRA|nr:unnamed protein product [Phytophthora lilii]